MIEHPHPQYSPAWWSVRVSLPTASAAQRLVTPTARRLSASLRPYAATLAFEQRRGYAAETFTPTEAMRRGRLLEARALAAYAYVANLSPRPSGFCTDDRARYGGSPDALIDAGVASPGGVEVKCPEESEFVRVLLHVEAHDAPPAEYLPQVHMLMLVTGRAWWDLTFWHPELPDEPLICHITRERAWDRALLRAIGAVRRERERVLEVLERRTGARAAPAHARRVA